MCIIDMVPASPVDLGIDAYLSTLEYRAAFSASPTTVKTYNLSLCAAQHGFPSHLILANSGKCCMGGKSKAGGMPVGEMAAPRPTLMPKKKSNADPALIRISVFFPVCFPLPQKILVAAFDHDATIVFRNKFRRW